MMFLKPYNSLLRISTTSLALISMMVVTTVQASSPLSCRAPNNPISMSLEGANAFKAYYANKFIAGDLHISQLICDLGQPHKVVSGEVQANVGGTQVLPGERYLRWGESRTDNPEDEVSISVVINADSIVQRMTNYLPVRKEITTISKLENKIKIGKGTYTHVVTKQ